MIRIATTPFWHWCWVTCPISEVAHLAWDVLLTVFSYIPVYTSACTVIKKSVTMKVFCIDLPSRKSFPFSCWDSFRIHLSFWVKAWSSMTDSSQWLTIAAMRRTYFCPNVWSCWQFLIWSFLLGWLKLCQIYIAEEDLTIQFSPCFPFTHIPDLHNNLKSFPAVVGRIITPSPSPHPRCPHTIPRNLWMSLYMAKGICRCG